MSPLKEVYSIQGHFLQTLRSEGEKMFLIAVWGEASDVASAAPIEITLLFNPKAFNWSLRSVVETAEILTPSLEVLCL
jgi:hypothetical protein